MDTSSRPLQAQFRGLQYCLIYIVFAAVRQGSNSHQPQTSQSAAVLKRSSMPSKPLHANNGAEEKARGRLCLACQEPPK
jgi:hypothetical protein